MTHIIVIIMKEGVMFENPYIYAQKHTRMCFGMAHIGSRSNLGFDFSFPFLKDDRESLLLEARGDCYGYHL